MDKKIVIVLIILGFTVIGLLINKDDEKKEKREDIPVYEADILCKRIRYDEETGEETVSNVYVTIDEDIVSKAIFQDITTTYFPESYAYLLEDYYIFYDGIKGIETDIKINSDIVIGTVTYNYLDIDQEQLKEELGDILDEEFILVSEDIPFTYELLVEKKLKEYECSER